MNNFKYTFLPVLGIIFITFAGFILMLYSMASDADEEMLNENKVILQSQFKRATGYISLLAQNNAVWNDTYNHIYINFNSEWIENNFGNSVQNIEYIDSFIIFGNDDNILYSQSAIGTPEPAKFIASGLGDYLSTLTVDDYLSEISSSGIIEIDKKLYIFAFSLLQLHNSSIQGKILPERRPALIFIHELNDENLGRITASIDMTGIRINFNSDSDNKFLKLDKKTADQLFVKSDNIFFEWDAKKPGSILIQKLFYPMISVILLVTLAFIYFYKSTEVLFASLKKADQAKSNFLAAMSHELRTPLNAIIGFSEAIKEEMFGPVNNKKYLEYNQDIYASGMHLLHLVNDVLDLSILEAGKKELAYEYINVVEIVSECKNMFGKLAEDKNIDIVINIPINIVQVYADRKSLMQILINLLSNAIKFTPDNGSIIIAAYVKDDKHYFQIIDTGIGISEEYIKSITKPFERAQKSPFVTQQEGAGLGLSIVQSLINLHNGVLKIKSVLEKGTEVMFIIPQANKHP